MQINSASNPMTYPLAANSGTTAGVQSKWSQAQAADVDDDDADGAEAAAPAHGASAASPGGSGGPSAIVSLSDAATAGNDSDSDASDDTQALTGSAAGSVNVGGNADAQADAPDAGDGVEGAGDENDSPVKSLTYGALGLESPAEQQLDNNSYYTVGRWLAAAVTIGGLVSLFA